MPGRAFARVVGRGHPAGPQAHSILGRGEYPAGPKHPDAGWQVDEPAITVIISSNNGGFRGPFKGPQARSYCMHSF